MFEPMGFAAAIARQQEAIFRTLGEDASWEGVTGAVRVIRRSADEELRLGHASVVATGATIRVRKSEVAAPAEGQQVQILDDAGNPLTDGLFVVNGEPELDRRNAWRCPIRAAV